MIPDAPGWWWLAGGNGPSPVEVTIEGGALLFRPGLWTHPVASVLPEHWLGPVAPPGSVSAEEHSRAVMEAHRDGRDADLRDTDAEAWGCSQIRSDLIARLTASGLDGEAIVREVAGA